MKMRNPGSFFEEEDDFWGQPKRRGLSGPTLPPRDGFPRRTEAFDDIFNDDEEDTATLSAFAQENRPPVPPIKVKKTRGESFVDLVRDLNVGEKKGSFVEMEDSAPKGSTGRTGFGFGSLKRLIVGKSSKRDLRGDLSSDLTKTSSNVAQGTAQIRSKKKKKKKKKKQGTRKINIDEIPDPFPSARDDFEVAYEVTFAAGDQYGSRLTRRNEEQQGSRLNRKDSAKSPFPDFAPPKFDPNFKPNFSAAPSFPTKSDPQKSSRPTPTPTNFNNFNPNAFQQPNLPASFNAPAFDQMPPQSPPFNQTPAQTAPFGQMPAQSTPFGQMPPKNSFSQMPAQNKMTAQNTPFGQMPPKTGFNRMTPKNGNGNGFDKMPSQNAAFSPPSRSNTPMSPRSKPPKKTSLGTMRSQTTNKKYGKTRERFNTIKSDITPLPNSQFARKGSKKTFSDGDKMGSNELSTALARRRKKMKNIAESPQKKQGKFVKNDDSWMRGKKQTPNWRDLP